MKKSFLFFVVLITFISCQEDIKFNSPSFQATKDNVSWRAVQSRATLSKNGALVIEAYTRYEAVTLHVSSTAPQVFLLGKGITNTATYVLTDDNGSLTFSTWSGVGNGQIEITEYDSVNKTVSGTFKFNAVNTVVDPFTNPTINFQFGVFYKVPVSLSAQ